MNWRSFRSSKSREQKKEAPSRPSANILSAKVCAIVLFPVPASPFSQYTGDLPKSLVHSSVSSRTAPRVPLRHPLRLPCRYSAPCAQGKLLRTAASAIGSLCQATVIVNRRILQPGSCKWVISFARTKKGDTHHLFALLVVDYSLLQHLLSLSILTKALGSKTNLVFANGPP